MNFVRRNAPALATLRPQWVAVISIAIPSLGFLWEFAVGGRKRLGCRAQTDTPAEHATQSPYAGVLREMQLDGHRPKDPSFVLLRNENAGSALIDDVLRAYGSRLCPEVDNPRVCQPS
ncbi:hypothetical protein P1P75_35665 [Streptomyces sp. ID05-39B]|uniref:hypothetical protein n=1 Tax=Streptomyces sp. ID05-39B TaxID=3028664 RepID=UPI0029B63EE9|nr:hypothetical protein [Streptomyces sp. ID05-39B]MDX3531592.1 hypothetical protein [Streptomyces sp. ID05-39B]